MLGKVAYGYATLGCSEAAAWQKTNVAGYSIWQTHLPVHYLLENNIGPSSRQT